MSDTFPIYGVFSNGIKILGADYKEISYPKSGLLNGINSKRRRLNYRLNYSNGFIVIRSRFWRETIRVKNVVSCRRLAYTLFIETTKFRSIRLIFETLSHASIVEKALSKLADGV